MFFRGTDLFEIGGADECLEHRDVRVVCGIEGEALREDPEQARRHRDFPADFLSRLELVASVLASAIYRTRAEASLREAQALNRAVHGYIERVTDRAMRALRAYSWPGNIRELENVVERALILSTSSVLTIDPLFAGRHPSASRPTIGLLSEVERRHILRRARAERLESRRQGQRRRTAGPQPLHPPLPDEEARDRAASQPLRHEGANATSLVAAARAP